MSGSIVHEEPTTPIPEPKVMIIEPKPKNLTSKRPSEDGGDIGTETLNDSGYLSAPEVTLPTPVAESAVVLPMKQFQLVIKKCVIQNTLIQTVYDMFAHVYPYLSTQHIVTLLECLEISHNFAQKFNGNMDVRFAIFQLGYMKHIPNLYKQETGGASCRLRMLIHLYTEKDQNRRALVEEPMLELCKKLLFNYIVKSSDPKADKREVTAFTPIVVQILKSILLFEDEQFSKHLALFYPSIVKLVACESRDIRHMVQEILIRIGKQSHIIIS